MPRVSTALLQRVAIHIPAQPASPVRFAAAELQQYLERLVGARPPVIETAALQPRPVLALSAGVPRAAPPPAEAERFTIGPGDDGVALAAGSPRALLDAAYALLEQLGCRWSLHGTAEEVVPRLAADTGVDLDPIECVPPFRLRGYTTDIMTWHYTQPEYFDSRLDDDRRFIDWMGKSGANTFFYIRHPFDTQLTIPELLPELERRGIAVEYGGHVLPLLLPREHFQAHPEYFPEAPNGSRTDHGNLCTSSAGALAVVRANAVQYVREYPEMRALHVWGADLWHGGWCHCGACRSMSVQDQSLRVCNAVASGLAEAGCARPVCYLAYHDTIEPALTLRPAPDVVAEFAPRERCYGHALNDPACVTNRRYAAALERHVELFAGRVRLFEYYGDAILFFGCAVPLTRVIAADLAYYRALGIREILMLQFGTFSQWAYPLNFASFAAATRGTAAGDACTTYCRRFAPHDAQAGALFAELESIMGDVVTYGDVRRPPGAADAAARLRPRLEQAVTRLFAVAAALDRLGDERLQAQAALLHYTGAVLTGVCQQLADGGADSARADAIYTDALQVVDAVDRRIKGLWGAVDLPIIHSLFRAAAHAQ